MKRIVNFVEVDLFNVSTFRSALNHIVRPVTNLKPQKLKKVFMKEITHLLLNVEHHVTTRQSSGKRLTLIENVAIVQVSYKIKIWFNMNDVDRL